MSSFPRLHKGRLKRHSLRNQTQRSTAIRVRVMPFLVIMGRITTPPRLTLPMVGRANFLTANCDDCWTLLAYPLAFTTSSALKRVGSPSTGIPSKRFHLAINGKIAPVSSSAVRGRTYASRHVWKKIGGAFFSAGVLLTCAWSHGKLSGCVDTNANAERLSWTHSPHSTRKGFFDIRAPAPSRQH